MVNASALRERGTCRPWPSLSRPSRVLHDRLSRACSTVCAESSACWLSRRRASSCRRASAAPRCAAKLRTLVFERLQALAHRLRRVARERLGLQLRLALARRDLPQPAAAARPAAAAAAARRAACARRRGKSEQHPTGQLHRRERALLQRLLPSPAWASAASRVCASSVAWACQRLALQACELLRALLHQRQASSEIAAQRRCQPRSPALLFARAAPTAAPGPGHHRSGCCRAMACDSCCNRACPACHCCQAPCCCCSHCAASSGEGTAAWPASASDACNCPSSV